MQFIYNCLFTDRPGNKMVFFFGASEHGIGMIDEKMRSLTLCYLNNHVKLVPHSAAFLQRC